MLVCLPALSDNYIWLYRSQSQLFYVIDPSDAQPVMDYCQQHQYSLNVILLTHKHHDHIGGVEVLKQQYPEIQIYAPAEVAQYADVIVDVGELIIAQDKIQVFATPGHTEQHMSYVLENHLFCGDTLFSAGCGRVFTQDYQAMFTSIQQLNQLPATTIVCPAHEYTESNLRFAIEIVRENEQKVILNEYLDKVRSLRQKGQPSVPTTLALERQINPFLQTQSVAEFTQLRLSKDVF